MDVEGGYVSAEPENEGTWDDNNVGHPNSDVLTSWHDDFMYGKDSSFSYSVPIKLYEVFYKENQLDYINILSKTHC